MMTTHCVLIYLIDSYNTLMFNMPIVIATLIANFHCGSPKM